MIRSGGCAPSTILNVSSDRYDFFRQYGKVKMLKDVDTLSKMNKITRERCQKFITKCSKAREVNRTCMDPGQIIR